MFILDLYKNNIKKEEGSTNESRVELLAVAAPGGVELDDHVLGRVVDDGVEGLVHDLLQPNIRNEEKYQL